MQRNHLRQTNLFPKPIQIPLQVLTVTLFHFYSNFLFADGLLTSLGTLTWPIIKDNVERIITVSDVSL